VGRVEAEITKLLTSRLDAAASADDMFAVFKRYNRLFGRPNIRRAVSQRQADIIKNVRQAVNALRDKQAAGYEGSAAQRTARMRDVPPVAGHIAWALKIKSQLAHLSSQLESVMGADWAKQLKGSQGSSRFSAFKKKNFFFFFPPFEKNLFFFSP